MRGGFVMKVLNKLYIGELVVILFVLLLPLILIVTLINHNNITRTYLNYKFPYQLPNLNNDINYFINKNGYFNFEEMMKEDFDKIIVINMNEDNMETINSRYKKKDDFIIEFLEENKIQIRKKQMKIEDYQLFLFLKNDIVIRYQEMNKLEHYYFNIIEEKIFFEPFRFTQRKGILE